MKDFFISYNKADKPWAEWIAWQLEEAKFTTVIQAWDFRPASNFVFDMQKALMETERTIAVLSPDYLTSCFTAPEWSAVFANDPTGEKGLLVPVRVRDCTATGLLKAIVNIDLVGENEAAAKAALLAGLERGRVKPVNAPAFPGGSLFKSVPPQRTVPTKPDFPGPSVSVMPKIWNVPHPRNPNFTGRVALLDQLHAALAQNKPTALTQAIHGLGGMGKTQLALEYAYRHSGDYAIVWWLRAEQVATLAADYAALAKELDLPEKDQQDQNVIVAAVKKALAQRNDWLLIFDNAETPEALRPYLPTANTGRIIITSRNPDWHGVGAAFTVETLPQPEAVELLHKITGLEDAKAAG